MAGKSAEEIAALKARARAKLKHDPLTGRFACRDIMIARKSASTRALRRELSGLEDSPSSLRKRVEIMLKLGEFPPPQRDYQFIPDRPGFKMDFAWPVRFEHGVPRPVKIGLSVRRVWRMRPMTRREGKNELFGYAYSHDCTLNNFAFLRGWIHFVVTAPMVMSGHAFKWLEDAAYMRGLFPPERPRYSERWKEEKAGERILDTVLTDSLGRRRPRTDTLVGEAARQANKAREAAGET